MADIVFIVQNKAKEQNREADIKLFTDVTLNIEHQFENEITSFPVERGADISDNIRVKNSKFTVSGVVADITISRYQGNAVSYDGIQSRRQQMYDQLLAIRNGKLRFTLVTGLDSYEGCVIRSFSVPVAPENANTFNFTLELEQIREVSVDTIDIIQAYVREDKKDDAATTSNRGSNQAKEVSVYDQLGDTFSNAVTNLFSDDTGG